MNIAEWLYQPFKIKAHFKQSLVLTYAIPQHVITPLIPYPLTPDLHKNEWGFFAVALVNTQQLRPAFIPPFLGSNFILAGFRYFVRYRRSDGKNLRGLWIDHSLTNKKSMVLFGNILSKYQYSFADIHIEDSENTLTFQSTEPFMNITVRKNEPDKMPLISVFESPKEARRFAGPLPFTFGLQPQNKKVFIVEGKRKKWEPKQVEILNAEISLPPIIQPHATLCSAFLIENTDYLWEKGQFDSY